MRTSSASSQTVVGMKILGIDPGYDRLGIALIEGTPATQTVRMSDCVTPKKGTSDERLAAVSEAIMHAITEWHPDGVAVEKLFFSINKKTALRVAEARGAILSVVGSTGIPVIECSPQEVKITVTGYGKADKIAVMKMVPRLVSLAPKKGRLDDELDAIAIGITGLIKQYGSAAKRP